MNSKVSLLKLNFVFVILNVVESLQVIMPLLTVIFIFETPSVFKSVVLPVSLLDHVYFNGYLAFEALLPVSLARMITDLPLHSSVSLGDILPLMMETKMVSKALSPALFDPSKMYEPVDITVIVAVVAPVLHLYLLKFIDDDNFLSFTPQDLISLPKKFFGM